MLIDIQERLAAAMDSREEMTRNILSMIAMATLARMPIVLTEQYPKGLGTTIEEIRKSLPEYSPMEKMWFDCCSESHIRERLESWGRKKIILAGMEAHVCILQTCLGLLDKGYDVHVVADAVCSRSPENKRIALELMRDAGAVITSTEIVLFQLLKKAGSEEFKTISRLIK